MAYSNYGAYVIKNGVDITSETCDRLFYYKDKRWNLLLENESLDSIKNYNHVRFTCSN